MTGLSDNNMNAKQTILKNFKFNLLEKLRAVKEINNYYSEQFESYTK